MSSPDLEASYKIAPVVKTIVKKVEKVVVKCVELNLNYNAVFSVKFCDAAGNTVERHTMELKGDEYANWGDNDDYVFDLACKKYNINVVDVLEESVQSKLNLVEDVVQIED